MSDFISSADAAQSASYADQKAIRDEVADIQHRIRCAMDAGLTTDEMKLARAAKDAADAASEILEKIF